MMRLRRTDVPARCYAACFLLALLLMALAAHRQRGSMGDDVRLAPPPPTTTTTTRSCETGTTIVAAYFAFPRKKAKHDHSWYLHHSGKKLLSIVSPFVIFTNVGDEIARIRDEAMGRGGAPTHIINMTFEDLDTVKRHLARIEELMRPPYAPHEEFQGYSAALYALYHAKPEMVARAAELNPFCTKHFIWTDFGSLRDYGGIAAADYMGKPWPTPEREHLLGTDDGKILMGAVGGTDWGGGGGGPPCKLSYTDEPHPPALFLSSRDRERYESRLPRLEKYTDALTVPTRDFHYWIAGALFGGRGKDLIAYYRLYSKYLSRLLSEADPSRPACLMDQYLMGAVACAHPELVQVVIPPTECCGKRAMRRWMFLFMYLSGNGTFPTTDYTPQELLERAAAATNKKK